MVVCWRPPFRQKPSFRPGLEDLRMDVAFAADGARVAQPFGDLVDDAVHDPLLLRLAFSGPSAQTATRHGWCRPGTEMLRAEVVAGRVADVAVDIVGGTGRLLPSSSRYWNSFWPGRSLRQQPRVYDPRRCGDRRASTSIPCRICPLKAKRRLDPLMFDMAIAQRGQSKTLVIAGIGGIADADHGVCRAARRPRPPRAPKGSAVTAQIGIDRSRRSGKFSAKATRLEYLAPSRTLAHWADGSDYCPRPRWSLPVAWI